ncbi:hypothetical protein D3C71_1744870 [compost metagenome]
MAIQQWLHGKINIQGSQLGISIQTLFQFNEDFLVHKSLSVSKCPVSNLNDKLMLRCSVHLA